VTGKSSVHEAMGGIDKVQEFYRFFMYPGWLTSTSVTTARLYTFVSSMIIWRTGILRTKVPDVLLVGHTIQPDGEYYD
jgi:hypothetical protein